MAQTKSDRLYVAETRERQVDEEGKEFVPAPINLGESEFGCKIRMMMRDPVARADYLAEKQKQNPTP